MAYHIPGGVREMTDVERREGKRIDDWEDARVVRA